MEWRTSIGKSSKDETLVRGYDLTDLIENVSFTEATYLILKEELPGKRETEMLNAIFVSSIEHGIGPPSTTVARIVASCGTDFNDALAAGLLAIGKNHGGAIEQSARIFQENKNNPASEIVRKTLAEKRKFPGFGHKVYITDPRARKLIQIAESLGFKGGCIDFALAIERELEKQSGKKICLNIDGAIAAIISEMGFHWKMAQAFFIIPRVVGMSAHVYEEIMNGSAYRRLSEDEMVYEGKTKRPIPQKNKSTADNNFRANKAP